MRILFVWTGLTSYMGDCWRRLASEPDVDLRVWIDDSGSVAKAVSFDASQVMRDLAWENVGASDWRAGVGGWGVAEGRWTPDIIFAVGWHSAVCRDIVTFGPWANIPKVCCFDMPWRWQFRCLVAPLVLGRFLRQYRAAFVPGSVCARYAKWLGFKNIHTGLFAIDTKRFGGSGVGGSGERYFLYIGRDSAEKRLDDLRGAHRLYREAGGKLALRMYGKGLEGGFVRPDQVPDLMRGAAAFVLASDFDPWPLVLLEAMSAGCRVIASDRCTNRPELGRNWRVFPVGDVRTLAKAMTEVEVEGEVEGVVKENIALAQRYDCGEWVKRVRRITEELC